MTIPRRLLAWLGIALVYAYRYTLGALFPTTCKYYPSCSEYSIQSLKRYGLVRGSILTGWRLLRCNPWSHGGVDRPEDQTLFRHARCRHDHEHEAPEERAA